MADIKSKLTLDNSQFERAAKISKSAISGLGKGLSAVGGAAKFAAASFIGAAGALTALVAVQTRAIDRLGKVSKVTGFAAETLQKFQFAAEQSGVTADNAALALRRFSRRLGEAQRGTGELLPALKKLGIEVYNNNGTLKSAEEVLFEFADGIALSRNESEQLSLAFKAFDSEGAELVETLKDGAAGLRAFFDEAEALGFVLTTDAIQGVEKFADEFNRLKLVINGVAAQFTAALAPVLESITGQIREYVTEMINAQGGTAQFGAFLRDKLIGFLDLVVQGLEKAINMLIRFVNTFALLLRRVGQIKGIDLDLFPELEAQGALTDFADRMKEFEKRNRTLTNSNALLNLLNDAKELNIEVDDLIAKLETGTAGSSAQKFLGLADFTFREFTDELAVRVNQAVAGASAGLFQEVDFSSFREMLASYTTQGLAQGAAQAAEELGPPIEEIVVTGVSKVGETLLGKLFGVARVTKFWNDWYTLGEDAMTRLGLVAKLVLGEELVNRIKDLVAASDLGDYTKTLAEGFVSAAKQFEDALADAFVKGKADFSQLADFIKQTLAKAFIQKTITGPLLALFGLASGGPAKKGQPYIIGEEGPEIFVPKTNGTVLPNSAFDSLAGGSGMGIGGTTVVNYNIQAVDAPSFQQLVARDPEFIYAVTQTGARRIPGR